MSPTQVDVGSPDEVDVGPKSSYMDSLFLTAFAEMCLVVAVVFPVGSCGVRGISLGLWCVRGRQHSLIYINIAFSIEMQHLNYI